MMVCLALSAFFSGTESAFTSLSPSQIEGLHNSDRKGARITARLATESRWVLITALIGNNLMNVVISVLASTLTIRYFGNSFLGLTTGVLTYIILIFGEVVPKHIAVTYNERWARMSSRTVYSITYVLRPALWLVQGTLSLMGLSVSQPEKYKSVNLLHAINVARKSGSVGRKKFRLLRNLLQFDTEHAESIITHRTKIFSLSQDMDIGTALEQTSARGFSRVPVYNRDPESIVGVVLLKDLLAISLKNTPKTETLRDIMQPPIFVPLSWSLEQLFTRLSRAHQRMAIVLDEFGGVAGLVTLEDLFEKIFGALYDEHEETEEYVVADGRHSFRVRATIPIALFNEQLSLNLPEARGMKTLSGYIIRQHNSVPQRGTRINTPFGDLEILQASEGRVDEVLFHRRRPPSV